MKLPADLRALVIKAAKDFSVEQRKTIAGLETQFKEVVKAGMKANELTAEQKKPFVTATTKVYAKVRKRSRQRNHGHRQEGPEIT